MKFQFDANQDFQLKAISSIVSLFEGQTRSFNDMTSSQNLLGVYPNKLTLSKAEILNNAKLIHDQNNVHNGEYTDDLDFSIEMETGTGKTYVYLRTIFELNQKYGWKKFIILVPSVAIREGVIKTLQITEDHFKELYQNIPYRYYEYQSKNITQVKHFAESNNIEIMIMTVGAFNKDANVLHNIRDQMQGEKPISYIKQVNPILILDEPQNMEGEATKEKLKEFNSLFRIRYSATHKKPYNLVYQLAPYDAYTLGIVKKIEVFSVTDDQTGLNNVFLRLVGVKATKTEIKADIEVLSKNAEGLLNKRRIIVKKNDDIFRKSLNSSYEGFIVEGLTVENPDFGSIGSIQFANGLKLTLGQEIGGTKEEVLREQIRQTIRLHFEKKAKLREQNIKVLSLFFIDRVDNYVKAEGLIRKIFIEEIGKQILESSLTDIDIAKIHKGYFALKNDEYLEREKAIAENKEAYELIMKEKERLLSFDEPTEFIFSHSALKEGWDNPNVFNICTLNMTTSTMKKRQEIGRGMRICVNQMGERIFAKNINLLSVIANESYSQYVSSLQNEFVEDGIYKAPPAPDNARQKSLVKLKLQYNADANFVGIWDIISRKTRFLVSIHSEQLIERCIKRMNEEIHTSKPQLKIERIGITITEKEIGHIYIGDTLHDMKTQTRSINYIKMIEDETRLTKRTIIELLSRIIHTPSFIKNPEKYILEVIRIIREELIIQYIEQVEYEAISESFSVTQFEDIESYENTILSVNNSIYESFVYDSEIEKAFAQAIDRDERVKLFIKLPNWYKVTTPIGFYTPDWAIVTVKKNIEGKESKEKVYFVIETKGDISNLRPTERAKIDSAKKHFQIIGVNYKEVVNYAQFTSFL